MPAELTIRQFQDGDGPRVRELNERALRDVNAYVDDPDVLAEVAGEDAESFDEDLHDVQGEYLDADGTFLVGEVDDRVVAMGALAPEDCSTARVTRMRVDPAHQRRGHGQRMLAALESRARRLDFEELVLDTTARQEAAQGLYETNGYVQFDREQYGEFEVLLYRKRLPEE